MTSVSRTALALSACIAGACGAATPHAETATRDRTAFDSRFVERDRAPHTPAPDARSDRGDSSALAAGGGQDQARATALALVVALLDGDVAALNALFAERVTLIVSGSIASRSELIERCVHEADTLQYEPAAQADAVIDVSAIQVARADQRGARRALAPGILASDLVVTLPTARNASARVLRRVACLTDVYVRPGTHSEIVGVAR